MVMIGLERIDPPPSLLYVMHSGCVVVETRRHVEAERPG